jgi:restriction endonuclease S subunit
MGLFDLYKKDSNDFQIKTLDDICNKIVDGPFGSEILEKDYVEKGVPFIRVQNITEYGFEDLNLVFISEEANKRIGRSECRPGDLVFTKTGRLGTVCVLNNKYSNYNIRGDLAKLELKSQVDPYYVMSYLNSNFGTKITNSYSSGSTRGRILISNIKKIAIPIPSPEIQKYIGDKVRKAEELREEAKTLQKEIDILLEVDMLLKEETDKVYNIYDSKINWTNEINIEDRIDPNFYQKKYISTIEKLGNNKVRLEKYVRITKTRYQTGNINKYIEISSINNSFGTIDEVEELRPEEIPTSAKYQVKEGDILVSLVRPTRKAISIVTKEYDNAICTGGFAVLQSKGKVPVEFLTAVLRTNFVGIQFERYCAGSTYPTINEDDVVKVFIPMYSENQINKITENYRRIIDNIYTSKKLIEEAKQDVEDLIEGNFDMSKVKANS